MEGPYIEEEFEFEGDRGDLPLFTHLISGSFAGIMEHVVLYPIDTIKVSIIYIYVFLYTFL